MFYRCQRFNSKPIQWLKRVQEERSKGNRSVPWSGAPDCPVCHRTVFGAPGKIDFKLFTFRFSRRTSAIIHRTVRCATGLSGVPAEQRLSARNGRLCRVNSAIQMSEQTVRGAPDCPVSHRTVRCHMRTKPPTVDQLQALTGGWRGSTPDTVRCAHRQQTSPTATILVGGYKYHPNRPLQCVGAQATFQVI
jgi:hypothetical protein